VVGYDLIERFKGDKLDGSVQVSGDISDLVWNLNTEQMAYLVGMAEMGRYYESSGRLNMDMELMGKLKEYGLPIWALDKLKNKPIEEFLKCKRKNENAEEPYKSISKLAVKWGVYENSVRDVVRNGSLQVVNFAAGGIATPADAALMMDLGADGIFVGSGIFKSSDAPKAAKAIVDATTYYKNLPELLQAQDSMSSVKPMEGISKVNEEDLMQNRST
jgi:hypothetical protein